jgi:ubiquinone/menaquinone biosynthesis C-methylase UbiE
MPYLSVAKKYAQADVVSFWQQFSRQGLQASEEIMLARYAPAPGQVLDLGCGSGRAGLALASRGYKVVGLDIVWEMAQAARAMYLQGGLTPVVLQADMRAIPCASDSYDVVLVLIAALQHIQGRAARQAALAEIARVLRPNGVLILALDNIAPALTCYMWWGWRRLRAMSRKVPTEVFKEFTRAVTHQDRIKIGQRQVLPRSPVPDPRSPLPEESLRRDTAADDLLSSRRHQVSGWRWHARGLGRTLRWRTWPGLLDAARKARIIRGTVGDTFITQVSLEPTPGYVYYHIYTHQELVADAVAGGLVLKGYHSGRELNEAREFWPRVRQLDKQVFYAFQRP